MAQYGLYTTLQVDRGMVEPSALTMSVENILGLPDNYAKAGSKRETTGWEQLVTDLKKEELMVKKKDEVLILTTKIFSRSSLPG